MPSSFLSTFFTHRCYFLRVLKTDTYSTMECGTETPKLSKVLTLSPLSPFWTENQLLHVYAPSFFWVQGLCKMMDVGFLSPTRRTQPQFHV
jgi:hypothetical protein